ncbi:MAG: hypothetical protein ACKPJD_12575 [Planctomycetaceae bacterium]
MYPVINLPKPMPGPVLFALLSMSVFFSGCSAEITVTQPVAGEVRVNGQPVQGVQVVFHAQQEQAEIYLRPSAKTGPDGRFVLSSANPSDGALPGRYRITLTWRAPTGPGTGGLLGGGVPDAVAADRFRGRYSNPQTSGLSFEVVDGLNTVPPIDVQVP